MKKKTVFYMAAILLPIFLFGNEGAEGGRYLAIAGREYDFVPRIFNFLIFAGLVYYLIAEPEKSYFVSRSEEISSQLKEIEDRLQAAKDARKSAEQALEESTRKAEEIVKDAENEIALLKERYKTIGEKEIEVLEKQFEEKLELESRKMRRDTIVALLEENIKDDDIPLSGSGIIDVITRKAA